MSQDYCSQLVVTCDISYLFQILVNIFGNVSLCKNKHNWIKF